MGQSGPPNASIVVFCNSQSRCAAQLLQRLSADFPKARLHRFGLGQSRDLSLPTAGQNSRVACLVAIDSDWEDFDRGAADTDQVVAFVLDLYNNARGLLIPVLIENTAPPPKDSRSGLIGAMATLHCRRLTAINFQAEYNEISRDVERSIRSADLLALSAIFGMETTQHRIMVEEDGPSLLWSLFCGTAISIASVATCLWVIQ